MTTIRVSDPVELVKVLPYQLGYHPRRSLAAVGLRGRRIALVQRLDLPAGPRPVGAAVDVMVGHLLAAQCTAALVVVYEDEAGAGRAAGAALARRVHDAGLALAEHVVVRGGRVYFPDCPQDCHPGAGVVLPADADVPAIADFVALGTSPCATRDEVVRRVAAEPGPTSSAVRAAARRQNPRLPPERLREQARSDWGRFLGTSRSGCAPASAAGAARMAASLGDLDVRDLLIAQLCPGLLTAAPFDGHPGAPARPGRPAARPLPDALRRGDARAGDRHLPDVAAAQESAARVERLCWLARHTPSDLAPGVLTVLACYTWELGDGTLARAALERALSIDPAYRLAQLVEQLVAWGIRPVPAPVRAPGRFDTPGAGSV